jgi:hypothetical protein
MTYHWAFDLAVNYLVRRELDMDGCQEFEDEEGEEDDSGGEKEEKLLVEEETLRGVLLKFEELAETCCFQLH